MRRLTTRYLENAAAGDFSYDDIGKMRDELIAVRKKQQAARIVHAKLITEVQLLEAFAHGIQVENADGWTTGVRIRDYLFRPEKPCTPHSRKNR